MDTIQSSQLWLVSDDPHISYNLGEALVADATLGILNAAELDEAEYDLAVATADVGSRWLARFPVPAAAFPEWPFAPDFWKFGAYDFASARLRDALAQPDDVVQFLPIDLIRAGAAGRAQDYQWMRVLSRQSAMDVSRSECRIVHYIDHLTGQPGTSLRAINRIVLLEGFSPRTQIFRLDESPTFILGTDGLAMRVLCSGCTGMEFSDSANRLGGKRVERYRTRNGVAERRVGYLD